MGVGVSAKTKISEKQSQEIEMVLVWDMPCIIYPVNKKKYFRYCCFFYYANSNLKTNIYYRYYTEKFGKENAALKIVDFALQNYQNWEDQIDAWQKPVLDDG